MKKTLFMLFILCSALHAEMTRRVIVLEDGESIDLVKEVPWPVSVARAHYNPPADRGGFLSPATVFDQNSDSVVVVGPTTITLEYGTPDVSVATESEVSSSDAIGN